MIEQDLKDFLRNASAVRVYPMMLPQEPTYPLLTYRRNGADRDYTMDGPSGLVSGTFNVDAWGSTYKKAKLIAETVRVALNGFSGVMGSTRVYRCVLEDDVDVYEESVNAYRVTLIFNVDYLE